MTWEDVLDRMCAAGLDPVEETYMEHYGKVLTAQRTEFRDRNLRCTYGLVHCGASAIEVFLFPSDAAAEEFAALMTGDGPPWTYRHNVVLHFPGNDSNLARKILSALQF